MTFLARPSAMAAPFARALTIAALMGTTFLATPSMAQTMTGQAPAAVEATNAKPETVEQRITSLHDSLKITASQEAAWGSVAQAMRDNSTAIEKLVVAKKLQTSENMTALDDLMNYQSFAQAHVDGLKNLTASFKTLYDSMPDAQKAVADQTFRDFGRHDNAKHG